MGEKERSGHIEEISVIRENELLKHESTVGGDEIRKEDISWEIMVLPSTVGKVVRVIFHEGGNI